MALPAVQNVLGVWDGFYQSTVNMDDRARMQVVITEQDQRRFMGVATIAAGEFPFQGTIAASGQFSLVGGGGGTRLEAHGMTQFFGDGSVFVQMHYQFQSLGTPSKPPNPNAPDNGFIILVRDTGYADAPPVVGAWDGTYQSTMDPTDTGPLTVRVGSQEGSEISGEMEVNGLLFDFVGTIGAPADPGLPPNPCHMIGIGPAGWFLVSGELLPAVQDPAGGETAAEFSAQYQVFFGDGSRDAGTFDLFQTPGCCLTS